MTALNIEQTKAMLAHVADAIIGSKQLLTEIDGKIGDGDHGIGMAGGMEKAKSAVSGKEFDSVNAVFQTFGRTMLMSMGGASGVIFGAMFEGGAKDLPPAQALDCTGFAALMRGSLNKIKQRGKASVGDKTMVDALEPAVVAMEDAAACQNLAELLRCAEEAARQGVEDTKGYVAKFGRAKSLMERSLGHQDAGATSVWLILQAMRTYVKSEAIG